jgi:hypothetical protein
VPSQGVSFDWSVNVGNFIAFGSLVGLGLYHRWKNRIQRDAHQDQQTEALTKLAESVGGIAITLDSLKNGQADMQRELVGVKETGDRNAEAIGKVQEGFNSLSGKVESLEKQGTHQESETREMRRDLSGLAQRVTAVETSSGMIVSFLMGDSNALLAARNLAKLREQAQEASQTPQAEAPRQEGPR